MKTQNTKSLSVRAKELALPIVFPLWPAFTGLFDRLSVVRATGIILGLLVCGLSAYSQSPGLGGQTQFESVSVVVPAGNACVLHPDGSLDPKQSIRLRADADGVVRFQAVRPTHPNSVDRLALDCTDSYGNDKTYSVDLRSEETFERRPFDPVSANLAFRPALSGDPLSFTQQELIQAGYGLRPDPAANPGGYQRWLAAVSAPAYKLRERRSNSVHTPRGDFAHQFFTVGPGSRARLRRDHLPGAIGPLQRRLDWGRPQWFLQEERDVRSDL